MATLNFCLFKDKGIPFYILMPLVMLVCTFLIFLPFGLNQMGLWEEWWMLNAFTKGSLYFITKHTELAALQIRPLMVFPHSLAYFLNPNSFFYWNLIEFLSVCFKGIALGYIVWWLYPERWVAVLGGLLLILYPADTQQLSIRVMSINGSVTLTLCAVASLLWTTRLKALGGRTITAGWASTLFLCGCLMYETALFLAPLPLLLWWIKYGLSNGWRTLKTQKLPIFFWLAAVTIELGYLCWIGSDPTLYQSNISSNPGNTVKTVWNNAPMLITIGFYRIFLHGWYDAARMLITGSSEWASFLPLVTIPILLVAITLHTKNSTSNASNTPLTPCFLIRWLIAAVLIALLGYIPYLSSLSHLLITQRTYLFAGVGGALFFTGLILTIQKRFNLIGAGIAGCLLLCGMAAQWMQLSHYKSIANKQKVILAGILEAAPRLDSKKRLFIIDRTGSLSNAWMLQGELLGDALTYLYGMKAEPIVCLEPGLLWSSFAGDKFGRLGRCVEQSDTWQIGPELPPSAALAQWWPGRSSSFSIQKNQLTTLIIEPDGQVHKKTPIPSDLPATPNQQARWAKILGCWPAKACHAETLSPLPNHFTFNFGEWWSMDAPIPGAGWQSTQWTPPAWQPGSFAWINQPQSSLLFSLSPHSEPYLLQLNLLKYITEPAKQSLKIVLNGHPLHHHWKDTLHALAKVDPTWLKEGINELLFLTHVDPNQGVSLGVESVKISPLTKKDSDIFQDVMKDLTCQNNFDFTSTGHVNSELLSGFSVPESHGRWTDGDMASFQCYKPKAGDPLPTKVLITAFGFNPDNHVQRAIVTINGAKPIEYLFTAGEQKIIELPIQQDSLNKITINISLPDSIIPNPGDRKLGIAIKSIKFL